MLRLYSGVYRCGSEPDSRGELLAPSAEPILPGEARGAGWSEATKPDELA